MRSDSIIFFKLCSSLNAEEDERSPPTSTSRKANRQLNRRRLSSSVCEVQPYDVCGIVVLGQLSKHKGRSLVLLGW